MITPRFRIEQTDSDLIFTIHAPYASISDAEIYADLDTFCFYASPYYLRLHLSGQIEETDSSKGSYDSDNGTFVLCVQKVNKGEHFENLDLITSLLTPNQHKKCDVAKPLVEVVEGNIVEEGDESDKEEEDGSEWYIDQCPYEDPSESFFLTAPHYGFANKFSGVFLNFKSEFFEVIELPDPDKTPASTRSKLRSEREKDDFSDDHYLADWAQPDMIEPFLDYEFPLISSTEVAFLDEELDILKDFPKKEYLLDKKEESLVYLSLVDLLFAYAYNARTTLGENTVESAWTVNKLSATLSWLQNFSCLKEVVSIAMRRSLSYPLYRHWELSAKVLDDVVKILELGKRHVLKCLLEVYSMFNLSEPRYILNQLFIRDYCIWIQRVPDSQLRSLSEALNKVGLCKSDLNLDLDELEKAAELVQIEEQALSKENQLATQQPSSRMEIREETLCKNIATLSLADKQKSSSSGTSDSEADSSSSDEDSSTTETSSDLDSDDFSDDENKGVLS